MAILSALGNQAYMAIVEGPSPLPFHSAMKGQTVTETLPTTPVPLSLAAPRTVTELLRRRAEYADAPIFGYPSHSGEYQEYTFSQLRQFSNRAARKHGSQLPVRASSHESEIVVALLGNSNLDYLVNALALSSLGFTVLFLSTRISETAILSLLEATGCRHILIHDAFQQKASSVARSLPELKALAILEESAYMATNESAEPVFSFPEFSLDEESKKTCWIIHSSGTTGLPKPIYQTHAAALRNYEQNMNMEGFFTLPLYHASGLSSVFRSFTCIKKIYLYSCDLPHTSQNLLNVMRKKQFEIFYGVPYALKLLSESSEGTERLAAMKVVMFGGSACPDALGDILVDSGVNLISHYGMTETGQLMTSFRPSGDKAWNYVRVTNKLQPYVRWEQQGADLYELVVLDGWGSKVATNRPDGSYATKDLFQPHPSIANAWKYSGRLDDTIVLMNGEKAVPVTIEQAVRQHVLVRDAVMFGSGKAQVGMMIVASGAAANHKQKDLVDAVWPTIVKENSILPAYAQLSRDMVHILPAETVYPHTDKGTVMRQAFYGTFEAEIEKVYEQLESRSSGSLVLSDMEMRDFLRACALEFMPGLEKETLSDQTDFFTVGMDSLQSMRFRTAIIQQIQLNGHVLTQNVVFDFPSIGKLSEHLLRLREGDEGEAQDVAKQMEELVSKYGSFPQHQPQSISTEKTCVVVTGATGSLGAHLVAQLALRGDIDEVCCLVRAASPAAAEHRIMQSLQARAVYDTLVPSARDKISSYPSDFSKSDLGLGSEVYHRISAKITTLIHSAWSVNFNKNLTSFEADCIAGAHNLMLLCLSSPRSAPASFNFCSSVSAVVNTPGSTVSEALPSSLLYAQDMGYAQSKLVTENLVSKAAETTALPGRVLRIGQVVADTTHGIWNATEAIPLMLQSATTMHALPALDESPRWLPVDIVAQAVLDISLSSSTKQTVFNITNPRSFHWTRDLLPALRSAGLSFEEVGQREWIRRLRHSDPEPTRNPTIKLVDFFANKYDNDVTERKSFNYVTTAAEALSPALREAEVLDKGLVKKFVEYFLRTAWSTDAPSRNGGSC